MLATAILNENGGRPSDVIALSVLFNRELYNFIATVGVSASGASKDSVVGPCPVTPEERAAAARKYNMTVADYEPYADNGEGWALF